MSMEECGLWRSLSWRQKTAIYGGGVLKASLMIRQIVKIKAVGLDEMSEEYSERGAVDPEEIH
jgi:hypothetical protein